jgi:phage replication O-like protein O
MANPQTENGFTAIANEIIDALCKCHPGGSEGQVLFAVMRKTYGWKKKEDKLSISQICDLTHLARRTVIYAIKNLEAKNMVSVKRNRVNGFNEANTIGLQKDYSLWVMQEIDGSARKGKSYNATLQKQRDNYKKRVVQGIGGSARKGEKVVQGNVINIPFLAPTKETTTTKEITKEKTYVANADALRLGDLLFSEITKHNPKSRLANQNTEAKEKTITGWARDIEKLILIDKQEPSTVEEVILFATHDNFWGANILSGKKLREKWDTLTRRMNSNGHTDESSKFAGIAAWLESKQEEGCDH